jgi:hypothetical protein
MIFTRVNAFGTDRVTNSTITIYLDSVPEVGKIYNCNTSTNPRPAYCEFINYCEYSGPEGYFMTNENATGTVVFNRVDCHPHPIISISTKFPRASIYTFRPT